jgi:hypothetical protein
LADPALLLQTVLQVMRPLNLWLSVPAAASAVLKDSQQLVLVLLASAVLQAVLLSLRVAARQAAHTFWTLGHQQQLILHQQLKQQMGATAGALRLP